MFTKLKRKKKIKTMGDVEQRICIKFCLRNNIKASETLNMLRKAFGDKSMAKSQVFKWHKMFKEGRERVENEPRSGRPSTSTDEGHIKEIKDIVLKNSRITVRQLVDITGISNGSVLTILHEHLHMIKMFAKWVPETLTPDQKHERVNIARQNLEMYKLNPDEFLNRFVTVDETYIHYFTESEQSPNVLPAKRMKESQPIKLLKATIFWDAHGIIFIDYIESEKKVTAKYYESLLDKLNIEIIEKRPHLLQKIVLFHHDNNKFFTAKLNELHYELMPHPQNAPDFAPSNYYLFANLKKWYSGKKFYSKDQIINGTNSYFERFIPEYYKEGISMLESRWTQCIESEGDYIEE